jgi:hypothetical protein
MAIKYTVTVKRVGNYATKHGMSDTSEFAAWMSMIARCHIPSASGYQRYGARGIGVCHAWRRDFMAFYRHIGPKPSPLHSVERMDVNGDYTPGNVRWATKVEQARNTRRTRLYPFMGRTLTLKAICDEVGVDAISTVKSRLQRGWPIEDALRLPAVIGQKVRYGRTYCAVCGGYFDTRCGTAKFCSGECKQKADTFRKRIALLKSSSIYPEPR